MQRRPKTTAGAIGTSSLNTRGDPDAHKTAKGFAKQWIPFWVLGGGMLLMASSAHYFLPPDEVKQPTIKSIPQPQVLRKAQDATLKTPVLSNRNPSGPDAADSPEAEIQNVHYHIVFSTGCSLYQDWQSFVFFYQAMAVNQPGTVTRIVSGCNEEDEKTLQGIFDSQIAPMASDRFKIHFTPDFSKIKGQNTNFVYFNKPFGMRHWLQNQLGFPHDPIDEDSIVVLMDPDQLILRPFTGNDFTNTLWKFIPKGETPRTKIEHGKPMGQMYGFGLQWKDKIDMKLVSPDAPSPVDEMDRNEAKAGYIVGPPYIATARDMYKIVSKWCDFAIPVHDQYPHLLAEMFAYCLAAAHLKLAHQTAASFMVSDVGSGQGEGWEYVDKLPDEDLCHPKSAEALPNVIHFCQRYGLGKFFFGKRRLPKDFLTCESPLLREPTHEDLNTNAVEWPDGNSKEWNPTHAKRNRFMLCHMIPALNAASTYFKQNHCDNGQANFEKSFGYHTDMS